MLVFKDTILGFVAGIQLSINDMLRPGDWITMEKYGANGTVTEVTLNAVKVKNFDNTITTIPPYALVSDAFQNWRGMSESPGRRIKRSINIDMNSVSFCTPEMLAKFRKISLLADYIDKKEKELDAYNEEHRIDGSIRVNGRRLHPCERPAANEYRRVSRLPGQLSEKPSGGQQGTDLHGPPVAADGNRHTDRTLFLLLRERLGPLRKHSIRRVRPCTGRNSGIWAQRLPECLRQRFERIENSTITKKASPAIGKRFFCSSYDCNI